MTSIDLAETFACPHLHGTISREACGARHRAFSSKGQGSTFRSTEGISGCCCRTCDVGAQHARGERPDVPLVAVAPRSPGIARRTRLCHGCGEPLPATSKVPRSDRLFALERDVCSQVCAMQVSAFRRAAEEHHLPECA